MTLNLGTWQAVVRKKMFKTGNFKALDRVVVEYVLRNSASNPKPKTNLAAAWQAWTQKFTDKGRTYKSSDRYTAGCALDDIARVVQPPALPSRTARPPCRHAPTNGGTAAHAPDPSSTTDPRQGCPKPAYPTIRAQLRKDSRWMEAQDLFARGKLFLHLCLRHYFSKQTYQQTGDRGCL